MLLTLTTTHRPATDLGFLLQKNPAHAQSVTVSTGRAHVFYPQADEQRCTAALLLEVDPVALARGPHGRSGGGNAGAADQHAGSYVNDRPYAGSSLLAVALGKVFASARRGISKQRPELAATPLPLEIALPSLSCHGGPAMAERFFRPLGWAVTASAVPLDPARPEWGESEYVDVHLAGTLRVADAVNHLYVGLPVLDDAKHYWVSTDEVDKLMRAGAGWLATHPEQELITRRYLKHQGALVRRAMEHEALARLIDDEAPAPDEQPSPTPLVQQRHAAVLAAVAGAGARRVVDMGCGPGALLPALLALPGVEEVVGADVSHRALEDAARRLHLDTMPERQRARITLLQSSLTYTDARLQGFDAAVLMEVIEHLDLDRLPAMERVVFGHAAPATVIVTTPNSEHNVRYDGLGAAQLRHDDHRFEWTRQQFGEWADRVAGRYGYDVALAGIGGDDPEVGAPTQLAVFSKAAT